MKWIRQFFIILLLTFIGEVLRFLIPLSIPAGIYGMLLLVFCLCLRIIKLEQIENAADFLIEIMPLCFIPAGVGLMTKWEQFQTLLVPILLATIVITVIVMIVTGHVTQFLLRKGKKGDTANDE